VRVDLLERFASVVGPADTPVPLFEAALAFAAALQDGDTWVGAAALRSELEDGVMDHCADLQGDLAVAQGVLEYMAAQGFRGERERYDERDNSLMDRVLERRIGLPITLSVLAMHLAERCGIRLAGIAFPGHFLVGLHDRVWDPFRGGAEVEAPELASIYASVTGTQLEPDSPQLKAYLQPAHSRLILTRMLENLRRHFAVRGDHAGVGDVLELLALLHPEVARIRELLDEQPRGRRHLLN
jgi:regulator of sirC expression with transglutaminase-like and TPR domain